MLTKTYYTKGQRRQLKKDGKPLLNGWRENVRVNPNNFFKRELQILPPHFVNTVLRINESDVEPIRKWVYENCHGRFSITKDVVYNGDQSKSVMVIGFEEPSDLTLFALSGVAQKSQ